jgi:hypothetical protein
MLSTTGSSSMRRMNPVGGRAHHRGKVARQAATDKVAVEVRGGDVVLLQ